jgi:uncharacterized protein YhaN
VYEVFPEEVALMLLRRITLERYGCFGTAEFEFRRGMNLIRGSNDSGKTLLLTALPAALCGVEHGSRMRTWGELLSCRVSLLFEGNDRGVRLTRDLESNLVRLEERGADSLWHECFNSIVPSGAGASDRVAYFSQLARLLSLDSEALLRALLDANHAEAVCAADGSPVDGLWPTTMNAGEAPSIATFPADADTLQQEIVALEAELAADRNDYQQGQDYLAWIRKRWELGKSKGALAGRAASTKPAAPGQRALEQQRDQLLEELRQQGLPVRLPADLPAMFATAEGLRQELAKLQLELTPLQRRKQAVALPGVAWPLGATLVGLVTAAAAIWQHGSWSTPVTAGCAVALLLGWGYYLLRLKRARAVLAGLEQELQVVESQRADALARQHDLAERFEAYGLPSAPVEMVKLQQLCRRNEELISRYRQLCTQLGDAGAAQHGVGPADIDDRHLRPEDLPEAEARLAALGESLRQREQRLQALRDGKATPAPAASAVAAAAVNSERQLLETIGQQLEKLTGGRYHEVRLEEGCLRLAVASGRWATPAACSRSTAACLTLAIRMALSQVTGFQLPVPVDDLPLQLDQKRRTAALRALERFSRDCQVLLASGDEDLAKRAVRERWHVIDLDLPLSRQPATAEEKTDAGQLHLL